MSTRVFLVALMLATTGIFAPAEQPQQPAQPRDTRPADLLKELSRSVYIAQRNIPASDGIFIEEGRVVEAMYALAREQHETVVPAGETTRVSKVLLLDRAVQVFFADDKCALLILPKGNKATADMTLAPLVELARNGIKALFDAKPARSPSRITDN